MAYFRNFIKVQHLLEYFFLMFLATRFFHTVRSVYFSRKLQRQGGPNNFFFFFFFFFFSRRTVASDSPVAMYFPPKAKRRMFCLKDVKYLSNISWLLQHSVQS